MFCINSIHFENLTSLIYIFTEINQVLKMFDLFAFFHMPAVGCRVTASSQKSNSETGKLISIQNKKLVLDKN
jgi:hypothetical protein